MYEDGKELNYSVKETEVPEGYEAIITQLDKETIQITNTYQGKQPAPSKKSPKTGAALPVAALMVGLSAAVLAVIGKKRK